MSSETYNPSSFVQCFSKNTIFTPEFALLLKASVDVDRTLKTLIKDSIDSLNSVSTAVSSIDQVNSGIHRTKKEDAKFLVNRVMHLQSTNQIHLYYDLGQSKLFLNLLVDLIIAYFDVLIDTKDFFEGVEETSKYSKLGASFDDLVKCVTHVLSYCLQLIVCNVNTTVPQKYLRSVSTFQICQDAQMASLISTDFKVSTVFLVREIKYAFNSWLLDNNFTKYLESDDEESVYSCDDWSSSSESEDESEPSEDDDEPSEDESEPSKDDVEPSEDDDEPSEDDDEPSEDDDEASEDDDEPEPERKKRRRSKSPPIQDEPTYERRKTTKKTKRSQ